MPIAESHAEVVWEGNLNSGSGTLTVDSHAFPEQEITWAARTRRAEGRTSPEELIASAHAGCYAMALANLLSLRGNSPDRLEVGATCTLNEEHGRFFICAIHLKVRGWVPGLNEKDFPDLAHQAEQACPVSNALRNNVKITVEPYLEGWD